MGSRSCDPCAKRLGGSDMEPRAYRLSGLRHAESGIAATREAIIGDLMRVATPTSQRYGDIYMVCEPVHSTATVLHTPTAVIEVVCHDSVERDLDKESRQEHRLGADGARAFGAYDGAS